MTARVEVLDDPVQVAALAHPLRVAILDALRTPDSAAGVARTIGESRQKVNHHVKALVEVGLVRLVGERRTGNFLEPLYESVAGTFMVSPRLAWGAGDRAGALRAQLPLEHLVVLGERVQRDATVLLDRAAFDGEEIPSLCVEASVRFKDEAARSAFMQEYLELLQPLLRKHGAKRGSGDPAFHVAVAVYPEGEEQ